MKRKKSRAHRRKKKVASIDVRLEQRARTSFASGSSRNNLCVSRLQKEDGYVFACMMSESGKKLFHGSVVQRGEARPNVMNAHICTLVVATRLETRTESQQIPRVHARASPFEVKIRLFPSPAKIA